MSFDKYVHHISQKYRLAVAISVIKSKPENVSIEEYLIQLQNKIRDKEIDPNETVCSDDFNFDDEVWNEKQHDTLTDFTKNDTLSENRIECAVNENGSQESQTILNDFVFENQCYTQKENSLGDTIRLLKEVSTNIHDQPYSDPHFSQITFCESQENNTPNENVINIDSQETQLYTLQGFTQDYSHVSQTQNEYFVISDKYIRNNAVKDDKTNNAQNEDVTELSVSQNVVTSKAHIEETVNVKNNINAYNNNENDGQTFQIDIDISNNLPYDVQSNKDGKQNFITETVNKDSNAKTTKFLYNNHNIDSLTANIHKMQPIEQDQYNKFKTNSQNTDNFEVNSNKMQNEESQINKEVTHNNTNQEYLEEMDVDTESEENVEERVPFKVIEELNRVKTFLNRKEKKYDGYSTDSGYRSDSQHRSSLRSCSQLSGSWLNQSAHCLFNHIMVAVPSDDIVIEIAQVLGRLIDRLHEDENYPPFLEELLETVDSLIRDVHTGDGWADHLLLTKDEKIQRVLLLNKSRHILKYSIEKITAILEQMYTNLMQENLFECTNIVNLENVCYIFNILETFIKRYKKVKDSSQSQNSQDILPKRSSLTELWRKKWNPDRKEIIKNDNKICVLKGCSDILNKIIIECMSGYSLVSFAALQCFNMIQD